MKKSIYNFEKEYKGYHILYNALNSSCIILNSEEYAQFNNFNGNQELISNCLDLGFYVNDNLNEVDKMRYNTRHICENNNLQFYRIYTTTACNAKCPYCFEHGCATKTMKQEDADNVIQFIKSRAIKDSSMLIEWFGGEPLINTAIIDYISKKLKQFCKKNNVQFKSRIISNGLLFNDEIIKKAKKLWNLTYTQITLDGLKDTYEKIKQFNTPNAFEKVIENISNLTKNDIFVTIRLNYNKENFNEILELIEFLGEKFSKNKYITVYGRQIMSDTADNSMIASEDLDIEILKALHKNGFIQDLIRSIPRRDSVCIAYGLKSYMILPDGQIGKCSQAISKGDIVGDVKTGLNDEKLIPWCTPIIDQKCLNCKLFPLCNGGCLYEKMQNKNYCFASEKVIDFKLLTYLQEYVDNLDK